MTTPTRRSVLVATVLGFAAVATLALAVPAVAHGPGYGPHGPAADAPDRNATAAAWAARMDERVTHHAAWRTADRTGTTAEGTAEHRANGTAPAGDGAHGPRHGEYGPRRAGHGPGC